MASPPAASPTSGASWRAYSLPAFIVETGGKAAIIQLKCLTRWPGGAVLGRRWTRGGCYRWRFTDCRYLQGERLPEDSHIKNQWPLLSLQSIFVRNWFGPGGDKILSLSFPTLMAFRGGQKTNCLGEEGIINQRSRQSQKSQAHLQPTNSAQVGGGHSPVLDLPPATLDTCPHFLSLLIRSLPLPQL